ncbi:MAG TPA: TatD family hydrolase [Terracidiphilus sp.]|nr:TatD family hydrolase [Terracidiphilus sp.]
MMFLEACSVPHAAAPIAMRSRQSGAPFLSTSEAGLLIDSHAHLDSPRYDGDRAGMLARAREAGVGAVLSVGIGEGPDQMHQAFDLCREFNPQRAAGAKLPLLCASAGVYPHNTHEIDEAVLGRLDALLAEPEVIACGEIGLDYYHEGTPHEVQRTGLIRQLEIAAKRKRPILIHCRPKDGTADAWDDLFPVLDEHWRRTGLGGIMHCFGGGWDQARRALDLGFLISFAGNLTYPKAQALRDVAARLPLDSLLVETDAPWLAPISHRGKRNEPAFVSETARAIAGLLGRQEPEIAAATTENFFRLFDFRLSALPPGMGN